MKLIFHVYLYIIKLMIYSIERLRFLRRELDKPEDFQEVIDTLGSSITVEKCNELYERLIQYCNRDFLKKIFSRYRFSWVHGVAYYLAIFAIELEGMELNEETKHEYMTKLWTYFSLGWSWINTLTYEINTMRFDKSLGRKSSIETIDDSIEGFCEFIKKYSEIKRILEQDTEITYQLDIKGKHRHIGDVMSRFEIPK